ncbi:MAG: diaminopimelate decarboxylase [Muribaculaceae bacterium]|nr:diaminopimelate decarboxylase [Muribaculaceae bacterium]
MGKTKISDYSDLKTPCFLFDETEFQRGIREFQAALKSRSFDYIIGYSVKTCSLPYALRKARDFGCMAEVVSRDEYQLATLCGFNPQKIIYNGPMKSYETFIEAVSQGAIVNIETKRELKWLDELPDGQVYKIGLRLNINISHVSPEDADGDDDNSRFGFSDETDEFCDAVKLISSNPKVHLAGLHIHRTTHSRSPRFYERSIEYAAQVIKKYDLKLDYLDVGGGYFGIFHNKPTFRDYAEAFNQALHRNGLDQLQIIIEPGNALTASSFKFLSEVIDVKRVDSKTRFVTTDGSRNDIDPFFRKTNYLKEILYKEGNRPIEPFQVIGGCSCLEYDRLFTLVDSPLINIGDRILYNNVGAYTLTLSPLFIRLWPRVYSISRERDKKVVRRELNASDIINFDS